MSFKSPRPLLRPLLLATACVLAFPSMAADRCEHSRSETPALDLAGISRVVVEIGADELTVTPGAPSLAIKHCASTAERAAESRMTVERRGDTLHIASRNSSITIYGLFGTDVYTWREISLSLPADMPLSLAVGSGDAALTGLSRIDVDVGSGDVALRQVGRVEGDVGSGDLDVDGATAVSVDVGSGDAVLKRVQGDVRASVGSGDVDMLDVGPIASLSAGSGSISVEGVRGDARIASVGSGDIALRGVRGAVRIGSVGSGDVEVENVDGDVVVADRDTLENIDTRGIRGRVVVGG
jgi:hypothetical protein